MSRNTILCFMLLVPCTAIATTLFLRQWQPRIVDAAGLAQEVAALKQRVTEVEQRPPPPAMSVASFGQRVHDRGVRMDADQLEKDPHHAEDLARKRETALEASFQSEAQSVDWAATASVRAEDALSRAAGQLAMQTLEASSVDCRSTQCRMHLQVGVDDPYEDLIMLMNVELAEILPRSRLVVKTLPNGDRDIVIYAYANSQGPRIRDVEDG